MVGHPERKGSCSLAPVRQRPTLASQGPSEKMMAGVVQSWPHPGRGQEGKGALGGTVPSLPSHPLNAEGPNYMWKAKERWPSVASMDPTVPPLAW